ncbi:MAG: hypothetical protein ACXWE6_12760 [Nitrososphaeraceae archaeon]
MAIAMIAALSSLFGVIVGGVVSYFLQKQKLEHDFKLKLQENKTENMAEETARYYLKEDGYYERSFDHLRTKLGGFEEEELRKILVRAGAVRFIRRDSQKEYWCLVERLQEKYNKDKLPDS